MVQLVRRPDRPLPPHWTAGIITQPAIWSSRTRFATTLMGGLIRYPARCLDSIAAGSTPSSRSLAASCSARRCWLSARRSALPRPCDVLLARRSARIASSARRCSSSARSSAIGSKLPCVSYHRSQGADLVPEKPVPDPELDSQRLDRVVPAFVGFEPPISGPFESMDLELTGFHHEDGVIPAVDGLLVDPEFPFVSGVRSRSSVPSPEAYSMMTAGAMCSFQST